MITDYEANIIKNVEEHGWQCSHIFDPDQEKPSFSYSVGFTKTVNCPEFIVFGLSNDLMNSMLWQVFRDIKDGIEPQDGMIWSHLLEGFDCIIKKVHAENIEMNYLNSAKWYWNHHLGNSDPVSAFQIVWPGAVSGEFPWDEGCDQFIIDSQPPLYLPDQPVY
ncbi:MAG: DUF4262 domain-containing protein [Pseudomonadota bacterium]